MYLEHFGLSRPPFKITPDTSLFFEGSQRGAALGALIYAIKNGEGIIKVVGEVGSGKTMLCRMLEVKLSADIDIVYIANPSLSPDNILHVIAHELELDLSQQASKLEVMQKIQTYLLNKHANNRQVVMFVEEAQSMPIETLEEIRLLSNLETDQNKLLQMVLFGQPELDEKLSQDHIRQLKERITHSFYLEPFLPEDTFQYLNFRMRAVGYRGPDIFNHKTAGAVKKYSNGLTRRINILADKSLMASFSEGKHQVAVKHVKIAAKDSDFEKIGNNKSLIYGALMATSLIMAVWLGTLLPALNVFPETNANTDSLLPSQLTSEINPEQGNKKGLIAAKVSINKKDSSIEVVSRVAAAGNVVESPETNTVINLVNQAAATPDVVSQQSPDNQALTPAGLFEDRRKATEKWFSDVGNRKYSIQLFLTNVNGYTAIEEFLTNVPESLDFKKIYIYETWINNESMYSVIYDDFTSYAKAVKALNNLADDFQISKPFVRRVRDLRRLSNVTTDDAT